MKILYVLPLLAVFALACGNAADFPEPNPSRVSASVLAQRRAAAAAQPEAPAEQPKQILFGDLHVHTTISADAFLMALPLMQGEGSHPPADACDYARFCSGLDFWSINDHAESISPSNWQRIKEAVRQCEAVSGDPSNPDLVTFLGWEWTQVGPTAATHFGHKNVIFKHTDEDRVPTRPISALTPLMRSLVRNGVPWSLQLRTFLHDWENRDLYFDLIRGVRELQGTPSCAEGVDVRQLPNDCLESAETPAVLFEKLRQWGFESIVVPHGTSWGLYTPPTSSWDKQLAGAMHDPQRQTLLEVYSGHGNAEEYRDWRPTQVDASGRATCPEPTPDYEPCCWRAGEIIRERCGDVPPEECERRVREARQNYVDAGLQGHRTVRGARPEEWLDCGQCRDCFTPTFNHRPTMSAQYALAVSNFDAPGEPRRFRFGFIASSDNHTARPGTGYKEFDRQELTEASGPCSAEWQERIAPSDTVRAPESAPFDGAVDSMFSQAWESERSSSFFLTGGLVAVHAAGRDRESIWSALGRREVYGTSGERILLWFDLLNGPDGLVPMGAEAALAGTPRFRVRAVGAHEQLPGCPEESLQAMSAERVSQLCHGECYHPGEVRRRIERIEVVRIRPQQRPGEPMAELIDDPWRSFTCPEDPTGCVVEFDDPDFLLSGRESIYYVRALQEPTPAVNGAGMRCRFDDAGRCVEVQPCWGDYRTAIDDDCRAPIRERAWSSPIFLQPRR